MRHDVRLAGALIGVIVLVFGVAYGRELPWAPMIAGPLAAASALLCALPSRLIAACTLVLAVASFALAVHWTLDERVSGGHLVLGACTVVWIAQRALEDCAPTATGDGAARRES